MKFRSQINNRIACSAAVAAMLFAAPALAQSSTYMDQIGDGNTAVINQSGTGNAVGDSDADRRALQNGNDNTLTIDQSDGDKVGTSGNYLQNNTGLDQAGNNNVMTIDQSAAQGQRVFVAQQVGDDNNADVTQSANASISTLSQQGNNNVMTVDQYGAPFQRNSVGDPGGSRYVQTRGAFQSGNDNVMTIDQGGGGNNDIVRASQMQDGNVMSLTQTGGLNRLETVSQDGLENTATIAQIGDRNGRTGFTGDAATVGVSGATVTQSGDYNMVTVTSLGDDNLFGVVQNGNNNDVAGLQDGNSNEAAILQMNSGNVVDFSQVGTGNNLAVTQN